MNDIFRRKKAIHGPFKCSISFRIPVGRIIIRFSPKKISVFFRDMDPPLSSMVIHMPGIPTVLSAITVRIPLGIPEIQMPDPVLLCIRQNILKVPDAFKLSPVIRFFTIISFIPASSHKPAIKPIKNTFLFCIGRRCFNRSFFRIRFRVRRRSLHNCFRAAFYHRYFSLRNSTPACHSISRIPDVFRDLTAASGSLFRVCSRLGRIRRDHLHRDIIQVQIMEDIPVSCLDLPPCIGKPQSDKLPVCLLTVRLAAGFLKCGFGCSPELSLISSIFSASPIRFSAFQYFLYLIVDTLIRQPVKMTASFRLCLTGLYQFHPLLCRSPVIIPGLFCGLLIGIALFPVLIAGIPIFLVLRHICP